ncbi:MAG: hypothetical protein ACPG3W_00945 [Synechococcus sp.]|uniref:hypothetical protein n=1 Tax=Synechococcus sp. BMK-MC-1 TaxID=1442551 RepID=UPI001646649E|nr:hypothetical protein [Synechococcus sp. BMK-MC-1]
MAGSLMRSKNNGLHDQPFAGMTTSITGIGTVVAAVLKLVKSTCQPLGAYDSALMMFITVPVVTS